MRITEKTIQAKNLRVPNPNYNPKAARLATIVAVVAFALVKLGVI